MKKTTELSISPIENKYLNMIYFSLILLFSYWHFIILPNQQKQTSTAKSEAPLLTKKILKNDFEHSTRKEACADDYSINFINTLARINAEIILNELKLKK